MALRKTLVDRLLANVTAKSTHRSSAGAPNLLRRILSRSDDSCGPFRRFLHQNNVTPSPVHTIPVGEKLIERIKGLSGERIRLDALAPPKTPPDRAAEEEDKRGITVEEMRKVLKVSQMEEVKGRLRNLKEASISYRDFVQICRGGGDGSLEHGLGVAKQMDESGAVLVLGNIVFLKPELEKSAGV